MRCGQAGGWWLTVMSVPAPAAWPKAYGASTYSTGDQLWSDCHTRR
jgi:hypothetical protein